MELLAPISHDEWGNSPLIQLQIMCYQSFIESYNPRDDTIVLLFRQYSGDQVIGILPLQYQRQFRNVPLDHKRLVFFAHEVVDFNMVFLKPGWELDVGRAFGHWLRSQSSIWDMVYLDSIPPSCNIFNFCAGIREEFRTECDNPSHYYEVDVSGSMYDYNSHFVANNRDFAKAKRRLLKDEISINYQILEKNLAQFLPVVFSLQHERRIRQGQLDKLENPTRRFFLQKLAELCERKGMVQLHFVTHQDDVMAVQLDFVISGSRYHYVHAYNYDYRRYSPGKLLLMHILEHSFADPELANCNFMKGEEAYKEKFATHKLKYTRIKVLK